MRKEVLQIDVVKVGQRDIFGRIEIVSIENGDIILQTMRGVEQGTQSPTRVLRVETHIDIEHVKLMLEYGLCSD